MANNQNTSNGKGSRNPKRFVMLAGVILVLIIISGGSITMKPLLDYFSTFHEEFAAENAGETYVEDSGTDVTDAEGVSQDNADASEDLKEEVTSEQEEFIEKVSEEDSSKQVEIRYEFRKQSYLDQHYEKHGIEMGFASAQEYLEAANAMIAHPDVLTKKEKEDNDDVYFLEETGEFAVVSTDGYLRTYYIADKAYFERQ